MIRYNMNLYSLAFHQLCRHAACRHCRATAKCLKLRFPDDPIIIYIQIHPHDILSEKTTKEEIDFTVDKIKEIVERLRNMSPLYEDFVKKNGKA